MVEHLLGTYYVVRTILCPVCKSVIWDWFVPRSIPFQMTNTKFDLPFLKTFLVPGRSKVKNISLRDVVGLTELSIPVFLCNDLIVQRI